MSSTPEEIKQPVQDDDEIRLLDLLIVLAKQAFLIITLTVGTAILAIVATLLVPNIYTAVATVLPPQQSQSNAAMLLGQLSGLSGLAASSIGIENPADLYVGMLRSRTVSDNLISRFDLRNYYDEDTMVLTRRKLANNTAVTAGKDGLITIEFDDEDPIRAAAIANAYVEELQKLTQSLAVTEAAQRRLFFEQQLKQAKEDLATAEVALKLTQEKTGLIKLDEQGRAIIEAVATLRAQISAKEVELRAMRSFATEENVDYIRTQQQLAGLQSELTKLERDRIGGHGNVLLPTGRVPEAGLEYLRKFRDVKYQETIFELLAKQLEIAKLDEAKEAAIVQIVDKAVPPDRKSKPKRALIVILATIGGAILAVIVAILREAVVRAASDPAKAGRLALLRGHFGFK